MGQYHLICDLDRLEFIHPHRFGDGLKLKEFGWSGDGTMAALAGLLSTSNDRGGGDLRADQDWLRECQVSQDTLEQEILGRWAGDRLAIFGDYFQPEDLSDWGIKKGEDGSGGVALRPGGPWGPDGYLWRDVSFLGLVVLGLDETSRQRAREQIATPEIEALRRQVIA